MESIAKRTTELQEQSRATIQRLEDDLSETRGVLNQTKAALQQSLAEKQALAADCSALKIAERVLNMKISSLQTTIDRLNRDARPLATSQLEALRGELDSIKRSLLAFAEDAFGEVFESQTPVSAVFEALQSHCTLGLADQRILTDAVDLRSQLGLAATESLSSVVSKMRSGHDPALARAEQELERLHGEVSELEMQVRENGDVGKRITGWETWAQSIYKRLTGKTPSTASDVRFGIEESLLSGVSQLTLTRKLDLLRAEKRLFTSRPDRRFERRAAGPVSIQSLLIFVMAVRRIQSLIGQRQTIPALASSAHGS
jgi:DNA repair exonuclease SbcCD ATPase subunit